MTQMGAKGTARSTLAGHAIQASIQPSYKITFKSQFAGNAMMASGKQEKNAMTVVQQALDVQISAEQLQAIIAIRASWSIQARLLCAQKPVGTLNGRPMKNVMIRIQMTLTDVLLNVA